MQERVKPLKSVRNFRDFGGYACRGGGRIPEGQLFRSGHFADASDADCGFLERLDIEFQVDLRRPEEREHQPNIWPKPPVSIITNDQGREEVPAHLAAFSQDSTTPESIDAYMVGYYQRTPFAPNIIALYSAWFSHLAKCEKPALVNCMAGKDRTGMICALTHHLLGVDEDMIMRDYMLTNQAIDIDGLLPLVAAFFNRKLDKNYGNDVYRPFLGVREEYLQAAFARMKERHGSLTGYIENGLGITPQMQDDIRRRFVVA